MTAPLARWCRIAEARSGDAQISKKVKCRVSVDDSGKDVTEITSQDREHCDVKRGVNLTNWSCVLLPPWTRPSRATNAELQEVSPSTDLVRTSSSLIRLRHRFRQKDTKEAVLSADACHRSPAIGRSDDDMLHDIQDYYWTCPPVYAIATAYTCAYRLDPRAVHKDR